ncbi:MAG: amino acid adenylation domain-containing protein [Candidatus Aminicenantes bacterium]
MNKNIDYTLVRSAAASTKIKEKEYWEKQLSGQWEESHFPYEQSQPAAGFGLTIGSGTVAFRLSPQLHGKLEKLSSGSDPKLHMILTAGLVVLLARYTGNKDIIIGTAIYKPDQPGTFINTELALRNRIEDNMTFKELLLQVRQTILEAVKHQVYPVDLLPSRLNLPAGQTGFPLYDAAVLLENIHYKEHINPAHINMLFSFQRTPRGMRGEVQYNSHLYGEAFIRRIIHHFINIMTYALDHVEVNIFRVEMMSEEEKQRVLIDFNRTRRQYHQDKTLHCLFAEQAARTPDSMAVVGMASGQKDKEHLHMLTYRQLNEKTNHLAQVLREQGIQLDTIVGLRAERSLQTIIGILGILKAGGAYLPIDADYPEARLKYMLEDSAAKILLTSDAINRVPTPALKHRLAWNEAPVNSLAYVIYTSGSTGLPKGVLIEHGSAVNVVKWFGRQYRLGKGSRVLLMSNFTFDASVNQIFGPLLHGAAIFLPKREILMSIPLLRRYIDMHRIHVLNFVPVMLKELLCRQQKLDSVKAVICGGDRLDDPGKDRMIELGYTVYNQYGPTETTIDALTEKCSKKKVTLGKPISNVKCYILTGTRAFVPIGIVGELYIGGAGLARGYVNNPELTSEKFINQKFLQGGARCFTGAVFSKRGVAPPTHSRSVRCRSLGASSQEFAGKTKFHKVLVKSAPPGRRRQTIYKTGDLARWLEDGNIEFIGRIDYQVKIRGFRIDPAEIESSLFNHPGIKESVVITRENKNGDKYLCAYIVPERELEISEVRKYLSQSLPDYMIPAYFVLLEKIPLTPIGKIDRHALPEPGIEAGQVYTAPRDRLEQVLVEIWSEVLGIEKGLISTTANFFELGGHSLKAAVLTEKVHKELDVKIELAEVFKHQTVRELAGHIGQAERTRYSGIMPVEKREYYLLSSAQKRLYFLQQMDLNSIAFNMPLVLPVGKIKRSKVELALKTLITRHESLRTSFEMVDREPVQQIHDVVDFKIEYYETGKRQKAKGNKEELMPNAYCLRPDSLINNFNRPFDLSQAPLVRSGLIRLPDGNHYWMVDIHHIVSDGTSHSILTEDFISFYQGEDLAPLRLQYKDFSQWQDRLFASGEIKSQENYWLELYPEAADIPRLNLPADHRRPQVFTFAGDHYRFKLEAGEAAAFRAVGSGAGATLFMNLLAVLNTLFYKTTGQTDIIIGSGIAGRPHADLQSIIGMFVNSLAMRNYPEGEKTYVSFLKEVMAHSIKAFENQEVQFEELVEKLDPGRDLSRNPLFDVALVVQNYRQTQESVETLLDSKNLPTIEFKNKTSKFDITFFVYESAEEVYFVIEFYTGIFKEESIRRLIWHFKNIIKTVAAEPSIKIKDIDMLSSEEKKQVLYECNHTAREYPEDKTIHELFENQAAMTPDLTVLVGQTRGQEGDLQSLTYNQLNKKSNQLANYLSREKNIGPGHMVGILMDNSIDLVIAILGILKAGAAYVPMDPSLPQERTGFIIRDTSIGTVISSKKYIKALNRLWCENQCFHAYLCTDSRDIYKEDEAEPTAASRPGNTAYVIYTSGTTGKPKGVMIRHQSLVNYTHWASKQYVDKEGTQLTFPLYTNVCFDLTVTSIYVPLITGNRIVIYEQEKNRLPIIDVVSENKVDIIKTTPSHLKVLQADIINKNTRLKRFIVGGEELETRLAREVNHRFNRDIEIFNEYGPTEATVGCMIYKFDETKDNRTGVPIGKPINNARIYILDSHLNPMPPGAPGEIYISGDVLAQGYLNDPESTAKRFCLRRPGGRFLKKLPPWTPRKNFLLKVPGKGYHGYHRSYRSYKSYIIYKTGDLARWLPEGNLEFLGRIDHQVKIRGFRIEPGEIESRVVKHQLVKEAVVINREDQKGENYLCAYVVLQEEFDLTELKEYLAGHLPDYMIPAYFIKIDKIPLTPNAKLDRKALPASGPPVTKNYLAPRNKIEEKLVDIWSEILSLRRDKISIDADFFHLGGHSLKATILASQIQKELEVKVPLTEIFRGRTIRKLAGFIDVGLKDAFASIEALEKKEYYPLSSAQERFYILQRVTPESTAYNMTAIHRMNGSVEKEKFEDALNALINRHEMLRTSFQIIDDQAVQRVHEEVNFEIEYYQVEVEKKVAPVGQISDAGGEGNQPAAQSPQPVPALISSFIRSFEFSQAPLLRLGLIKLAEETYILMFDMHHIISDGTAMIIFLKEFMAFYGGNDLQPLSLQYKDFARWQKDSLESGKLKNQEAYWLEQFRGEVPVLNMPVDFPRPQVQGFAGDRFDFWLEEALTQQLKRFIQETGATLFMVLLAVYNVLLARYTGQEDIVIGTTIAGRSHADLQDIIGLFIETLALRNYPAGDQTFSEFLYAVKHGTLDAYDNQDYPFKELIKKLGTENEISRNPVFDAMLMVHNFELTHFELEGLEFSPYEFPEQEAHHTSKVDFTLEASELAEEIHFFLEYCTLLYKRETMERFARHFINIIREVVNDPGIRLSAVEMIDKHERQQILAEFNHTYREYTPMKMAHELFVEKAGKTPDNIAVVGPVPVKNRTHRTYMTYISYQELNLRASQLARLLIEKGVQPDTIVGIMVEPSIEMVVAVWGILKAGAAYLPIDPDYPEERIDYMLKDSRVKILVKKSRSFGNLSIEESIDTTSHPPLSPWIGASANAGSTSSTLTCRVNPADLAYIIYTSGTTGRPKGVMVDHRNLIAYIHAFENEFDLRSDDTVVQQVSYAFDAFVEELYPILLKGGKLAIPGKEVIRDISLLCDFIARHRVTFITCAPQLLNELNHYWRQLSCLRILISGGDRLKAEYIDNLLKIGEVYNTYGPTESTVCATYYRCIQEGELSTNVPIGKPIFNYRVHILDRYLNLLPIGLGGELCVAGGGVTRGYLNRVELTADKFDQDFWDYQDYHDKKQMEEQMVPGKNSDKKFLRGGPGGAVFSKRVPPGRRRHYKTGDLARWLSDGNIEFLGRIDRQVKVRGYRIELGEIENHLLKIENIKKAIVIEKERKSGQNYLAAYVVIESREPLDTAWLKSRLSESLPGYMVPTHIMAVEEIPLTPSGKPDRERLVGTGTPGLRPYTAPQSHREKRLAEIWQEVLEKDSVGLDDNFFDLGGTSLDIFKVNTRIKEEFEMQIPVVSMFKYSTVRSLVRFLDEELGVKGISSLESKEVLDTIVKGQDKLRTWDKKETGFEIAVIGMAGVFPGAGNIDEFWGNLKNGIDSIGFFTKEELLAAGGVEAETLEKPEYVNARGIIESSEYFDAHFFGYSPMEARIMDPQMRVFFQCVWHALEHAGYDPFSYHREIGLYAGASPNIYREALTTFSNTKQGISGFLTAQLVDKDFMCSHISYKLNLKGPSFTFHTACSTSLVAIHLAVQGLLLGECEMALAGGVSIAYPPQKGYLYQEGMIYSADGHHRTFDSTATGSVFGDGAGVVVLKSLGKAKQERDHIYAVIRGSAINNDGMRKPGFTAPSIDGQVEVIKAAQLAARVEPDSITYLEAHGTATPLGDTVEIEALKQVFNTGKKRFCAIGTVKTNVGHLYSAAGAAGFIKTVLALKHRLIPPGLHFYKPNPQIDFENSPFYVNTQLKEWKSNGNPLRAGVSSFGIGGTNAHVVLEEAPIAQSAERKSHGALSQGRGGVSPPDQSWQYHLILLSAKTLTALDKMTENLVEYFKKNLKNPGNHEIPLNPGQKNLLNQGNPANPVNPGQNSGLTLADAAYTLQVGRRSWEYRKMLVCSHTGINEIIKEFSDPGSRKVQVSRSSNTIGPLIFMFPGLGAQYIDMGAGLYRSEPVFRKELDRCFEILRSLMDCDIKAILYPGKDKLIDQSKDPDLLIDNFDIAQAVIFAFEYALAALLMEWGLRPGAMIGYSLGEYTAACLAGVLELEDALKLITARGRLLRQLPRGLMLSIPLEKEQLQPLLLPFAGAAIAIDNGPSCVVAGPVDVVTAVEEEMKTRRCICMRINTSQALHSSLMEPLLLQFTAIVNQFTLKPPQIPYISNVTGTWITDRQAVDPGYWAGHLRETVRFSQGINELMSKENENAVFLEIGPGRDLSALVLRHLEKKPGFKTLHLVRHPGQQLEDVPFLLNKLGRLWLWGVPIDWRQFYAHEKRYRVPLPLYPFAGRSYPLPEVNFKPGTIDEIVPPQEEEPEQTSPPLDPEQRPALSSPYQAPDTKIEKRLVRIWEDFFSIPQIGIHDDFLELGGDSLKAITFLARLRQEMNVDMPLTDFFRKPTINALKEYMDSREKDNSRNERVPIEARIEKVEEKEYYFLPPAQRRFYILQQMHKDSSAYNMPLAVTLEGKLERERLQQAFAQLIHRHESLRTSFTVVGSDPVGVVHHSVPFEIEYYDASQVEVKVEIEEKKDPPGTTINHKLQNTNYKQITNYILQITNKGESFGRISNASGEDNTTQYPAPKSQKLRAKSFISSFIRPFDLVQAPLLRVRLVKLPHTPAAHRGHPSQEGKKHKHLLMVDMHHIVSDGVSQGILISDFQRFYRGETGELPALYLRYRDFAQWQIHWLGLEQMNSHEAFWLKRLVGRLPVLHLPTDFPRPAQRSHEGTHWDFTLGKDLTQQLRQFIKQRRTTLYIVLLTALNILLYRYTGQEDIIVGSPIAGRYHADLEHLIGLLIGSVMMRNYPNDSKTVDRFLEEVKETTLSAYEHQAYPFEELLKKVHYDEDPGRTPITDISLIVQEPQETANKEKSFELNGELTIAPASLSMTQPAKVDITLNAHEANDDIYFSLVYCTRLFKEATMKRLARHFMNILLKVMAEPGLMLADLDMSDDSEKQEVMGLVTSCYPLSHPQKRIYYTEQKYPGTGCNNLSFGIRFREQLNKELLERAINAVIRKNDGLRLRVVQFPADRQPKQYVHPYEPAALPEMDFSSGNMGISFDQWAGSDAGKPFELHNHPLFYFAYIRFNPSETGYYMKLHHLVCDGWTTFLLFTEIHGIYCQLEAGKSIDETPNPSYINFIPEEKAYLQSPRALEDKAFWHQYLIPLPEPPDLSPLKRMQKRAGNAVDIGQNAAARAQILAFPPELSQRLEAYRQENKTTIYKLIMAGLTLCLWCITGKEDIVIGSAGRNRTSPEHKQMVGMFVSTIPVRIQITEVQSKSFSRFLEEVGQGINRIIKHHQRYPFDLLAEEIRRETGVDPGYLLTINLVGHGDLGEERFRVKYFSPGYEPTSLALHINSNNQDIEGLLELEWDYQVDRFSGEEVEILHQGLINLLADALDNPRKSLAELELLSRREKEQILCDFNNSGDKAPHDKTICRLFAEQVEQNPDYIAIVGPLLEKYRSYGTYRTYISYKELNRKSQQLARILAERGVGHDTIVGLMMEPSLEMIIGILGILKAGGAYLPIDPEYPEDRKQYMLKDSGARILLKSDAINRVPTSSHLHLLPWINASTTAVSSSSTLACQVSPANLAYIIYTSGTTGRPKGVAVAQCQLAAYIHAFLKEFDLRSHDTVIQQAAFIFDAFVEEMYPILLRGGKLAIPTREQVRDIKQLAFFIARNRVTMITCSPLMLNELNKLDRQLVASIRIFISGGDILKREYIENLLTTGMVYNTYGPTETTVCAAYYRCQANESSAIPIGKPITGYRVTITNRYSQLLPLGVAGELCIAGNGVSEGYLNRPGLTAEKFLDRSDRFYRSYKSNRTYIPKKIYQTGDLGRWLADGNIEFLGRIDHQVKIRGFRIEPGEIEAQLLALTGISDAVVVARQDKTRENYLCAYIVSNKKYDITELRQHLARQLPGYMMPSFFVLLEKLPLTSSGKIDKNALPEPGTEKIIASSTTIVPPRDDFEKKLVQLWAEILEMDEEKIGIESNFFELGGHSLNAVSFISELYNQFRVELPAALIFELQTIEKISRHLKEETYIEKPLVTFNPQNSKSLFCFPPGIGFGMIYKELSLILSDYRFYAFNFMEEENRVEEYVRIIRELQPEGPYILLGYSAAASLVFEISNALENSGCQVSDIIFLDCIYDKDPRAMTGEEKQDYSQNLEAKLEQMGLGFVKEKVITKSLNYVAYVRTPKSYPVVNAGIHLVLSQDTVGTDRANCWQPFTNGGFWVYNGFGSHYEMLDPDFLEQNAKVIREILTRISHRESLQNAG